jgi:hypothetical protein
MAKELKHIDITNRPELLQIVEEAASANEPIALEQENKIVAVLRPVKKARPARASRGKPLTKDDPLWDIVGMARSTGPGDVAENKYKYLADAYADRHE